LMCKVKKKFRFANVLSSMISFPQISQMTQI
jgi:hypothetical protein